MRSGRDRPRAPVLVALFTFVGAAGAQLPPPLPNRGPALLLRLDGVLEATSRAAGSVGFTVASLGFLGEDASHDRFLGVTDARTVGGDHPLDGKDVLNALAPFRPTLLVAGPARLVAALRDLPAGSPVEIEGLVDRGSRIYYLRRVGTTG